MIIVAIIILLVGISEFIKDYDKIALIWFPILIILLSIVTFIHSLKKILLLNKFEIIEGIIEQSFYDNTKNCCKLKIQNKKGIVIIPNQNFNVGEIVYVIEHSNNALMCYSKNKYYL